MKPPQDIKTPVVAVAAVHNDMNEHEARSNGNGNGSADAESDASPYDMQALVDGFRKLPLEEQTHRLLMLYLANQGDDGMTRRLLADHKMQDDHEFAFVKDELDHVTRCVESIAAHFSIALPPRPKERRKRKGEL